MSLFESKTKIVLRLLSLLTVVRIYNVLALIAAQYLCSAYILSKKSSFLDTLLDPNLFILVLASSITVASGFIINSFYDAGKDFINRPISFSLEQYLRQSTKLLVYFWLNFLAVLLSAYISFRAALFFVCYIFAIWLYSQSLKKIFLVGTIVAPVLVIAPFFAIFLYYKNVLSLLIVVSAIFLFFLILIKNLIKDLENLKGDFVFDYKTISVSYGENISKIFISVLLVCNSLLALYITYFYGVGRARYYFYLSICTFLFVLVLLWLVTKRHHYMFLRHLLKVLILVGLLSMPFWQSH